MDLTNRLTKQIIVAIRLQLNSRKKRRIPWDATGKNYFINNNVRACLMALAMRRW